MAALAGRTFLSERQDRVLALAIFGSIALHAALLVLLPALREAQRREAREPIVARLVEPPAKPAPIAPPSAPPLVEAKKPVAESTHPAPVRATPKAKPKPKLAPAPAPALARQAPEAETPPAPRPEPSVEPPAPQIATPSNAVPAPPTQSRSVAIQASPAPPASDAPDAGTLAQYRLAVIVAAKRYKRYPRLALDNNWQGKVEVRMTIGADGSIADLNVRSSTGHSLLDRQAIDMIERAKAAAQIPPALRGKQFVVDIPVEFLLREPGAWLVIPSSEPSHARRRLEQS